jgi:hypothetical protein
MEIRDFKSLLMPFFERSSLKKVFGRQLLKAL